MLAVVFRILEVRSGDDFIPIGIIVARSWRGPFGGGFIRRAEDCSDLPVVTTMAPLVLFDELAKDSVNLAFVSVPERYAKDFRLQPPDGIEASGNEEEAVGYVFHHRVMSHPYYENRSAYRWDHSELPKAAA